MKISIGENIKRLRKSRDITQEKLAEALSVSVTAVSKWEREETYPDITLIFPLAHYFDVSVDELMGYNREQMEEEIRQTVAEYHRLARSYQSTHEFITEAYRKYPNDYRIMDLYMWDRVPNADCRDEVILEHSEELSAICDKILEGCTEPRLIMNAKNMQAKILKAQGRVEEAIAFYHREFPDFLQNSYQKIEQLFPKESEEFHYWNRMNLYRYMDFSAMKCARMYWYRKDRPMEERVAKCEQIIDRFAAARMATGEGFLVIFEKSLAEQMIYLMAAEGGAVTDIARFLDKFLAAAQAETEILSTDAVLRDGVLVPYKTENVLAYHVNHWKTSSHWSIARLRQEPCIRAVLAKYEEP